MKKIKKLVAVMLAAIMVMSMGMVSVSAAYTTGNGVIQISGSASENHTYTAYQIFAGTYNTGGTLTNVSWGYNISTGETVLKNLLTELDTLFGNTSGELLATYSASNTAASAQAVAAALNDSTSTSIAEDFAKIIKKYLFESAVGTSSYSAPNYTISGLSSGYYFVQDSTTTSTSVTNDVTAAYILTVVDGSGTVTASVEVNNKVEVPSVDKTVDNNGTASESNTAAYGDTVTFYLTITIPDDIADYTSYYLQVTDTLSTGFSLSSVSITSVTYQSLTGTNTYGDVYYLYEDSDVDSENYYVVDKSSGASDNKFTITFNDLYKLYGATSSTTVKADASSISNTLISAGGKIVITYTATLNADGSNVVLGNGENNNSNSNTVYLTYSNDPDNNTKGTSTPDLTKTYVTKVVVDKVDQNGAALQGAAFTLYKCVATNYTGTSGDTTYTASAKYYYYDTTNNKMVLITSDNVLTLSGVEVYEFAETITGSSSSVFTFDGLAAGTYILEETTVPSGYNAASPLKIVITYDSEFSYNITKLNSASTAGGYETVSTTDGTYEMKVANISKSSTIPVTGGMGTTILYIIGAILVIGAAVILVTRRRMANK